jgi:hypothetical protein
MHLRGLNLVDSVESDIEVTFECPSSPPIYAEPIEKD